ncbi:MAG: tRNA (uridine(34)/cytosine(34)/5-carboxymethylaminomethyluridine(34)-2'-O)-methyltransferase TrmL [Gammaproteobacteria bacterium]|nr:MAG: tRNA (uridine(34)/cytosine(34)/5-carboxymethylaminomethyluridine(34)-2'-O)-methyltransferase TrmL [Gammaproteobacteria bacterium]
MFHIALAHPEIPPNTGNIIRLCANTGSQLHLIHPIAFRLDDKRLRRAGLDYHEWASVKEYPSMDDFFKKFNDTRVFALSTHGTKSYADVKYQQGDVFLFGSETRGLGQEFLSTMPKENVLRLPMLDNSRSLNLSNTAAIMLYEAWRQNGFGGARR